MVLKTNQNLFTFTLFHIAMQGYRIKTFAIKVVNHLFYQSFGVTENHAVFKLVYR